MGRKKVLAICGSTRQNSVNHNLLRAIADLSGEYLEITVFDGIVNLPHFNPDQDSDNVASEVSNFRRQLDMAEGVIICTPEYAHGVPGSLKNALDWTVSSCQFPQKPTLLITAATDGKYGHKALLETLKALDAKDIDRLNLTVDFAKTKISMDGKITNEVLLNDIRQLLETFLQTIDEDKPV